MIKDGLTYVILGQIGLKILLTFMIHEEMLIHMINPCGNWKASLSFRILKKEII